MEVVPFAIVPWLLIALAVARIAQKRGHSANGWASWACYSGRWRSRGALLVNPDYAALEQADA